MPYVDTGEIGSPEEPGGLGTLLFENGRVKVWELVLEPGEICEWHKHDMDHLLIVLSGCSVGTRLADGSTSDFEIADGSVLVQPAKDQAEVAWNNSTDRTLRELIVELKNSSSAETVRATFRFLR